MITTTNVERTKETRVLAGLLSRPATRVELLNILRRAGYSREGETLQIVKAIERFHRDNDKAVWRYTDLLRRLHSSEVGAVVDAAVKKTKKMKKKGRVKRT